MKYKTSLQLFINSFLPSSLFVKPTCAWPCLGDQGLEVNGLRGQGGGEPSPAPGELCLSWAPHMGCHLWGGQGHEGSQPPDQTGLPCSMALEAGESAQGMLVRFAVKLMLPGSLQSAGCVLVFASPFLLRRGLHLGSIDAQGKCGQNPTGL